MGVYTTLLDGLQEVDVVIAGGKHKSKTCPAWEKFTRAIADPLQAALQAA